MSVITFHFLFFQIPVGETSPAPSSSSSPSLSHSFSKGRAVKVRQDPDKPDGIFLELESEIEIVAASSLTGVTANYELVKGSAQSSALMEPTDQISASNVKEDCKIKWPKFRKTESPISQC